jgi:hypothetical protein
MAKQKIDKAFVSEYDLFLATFDKKNPEKSASQQKEIDKYRPIFEARDGEIKPKRPSIIKRLLRVIYS